jgi:lysozyme
MKTSAAGIRFMQSFEALRLDRYADAAGLPTIGYGHRIQPGEAYQIISPEQADALFRHDLAHTEQAVNQAVEVVLAQSEFDACASLALNIGGGNFARSTLVRLLNSGNTALASNQFLVWDHCNGKEVPGLYARRVAEKALFDRGVYANHT